MNWFTLTQLPSHDGTGSAARDAARARGEADAFRTLLELLEPTDLLEADLPALRQLLEVATEILHSAP